MLNKEDVPTKSSSDCKSDEVAAAGAVSNFKLPDFWTFSPEGWFASIENTFLLRGVKSDSKKFQHVVAALPQDIVVSVLDIIRDPPILDSYNMIKQALISRHTMSDEKRMDSLFSKSEMGSRKPSEYYRHMELLAGDQNTISRELLTKLWMARLPMEIRVGLMGSGKTASSELVQLADRIWDASTSSAQFGSINSVSRPSTSGASAMAAEVSSSSNTALVSVLTDMMNRFKVMETEISELRQSVNRRDNFNNYRPNNTNFHGRSRQRNSYRSPRPNSRSKSRNRGPFCYYHTKFGAAARGPCRGPCSFYQTQNQTNC